MKKTSIITMAAAVLLIAALAAGCAAPASSPSAPATTAPTTAPATTAPATATTEALSGKITVVGSTSVGPYIDALAKNFMTKNPGVTINVQQVGSGQGIANTIDGTADIGMSSRELKDSEKPLVEFKMAKDGIAVVVQKDNPVNALTKDQIKDIYMGKIKNWKELGGSDAAINLYTRESTSGTRGGFEELVLGKNAEGKQVTIDEKICAAVLNSTGDLAAAVGKDKNGIGYISLGVLATYPDDKALDVDGVKATTDNVGNGSYKIQRDFLLLTKSEPAGIVKAFLDYVLTDKESTDYQTSKGLVPIAK